jgi:hypothetical protein
MPELLNDPCEQTPKFPVFSGQVIGQYAKHGREGGRPTQLFSDLVFES